MDSSEPASETAGMGLRLSSTLRVIRTLRGSVQQMKEDKAKRSSSSMSENSDQSREVGPFTVVER
jgi:hypothetical protein